MKVHEVMTTDVECCGPDQDLAAVAMIMWRRDCGVVPVVDPHSGQAIGVVTDRDICMAAATKHRRAGEIAVHEVCSRGLHACRAEDDLSLAMEMMRSQQVRRVVVVDGEGRVQGIVSLHDLVTRRPSGSKTAESEIAEVLRGISGPATEIAARPARRSRSTGGRTTRRPATAAYARSE